MFSTNVFNFIFDYDVIIVHIYRVQGDMLVHVYIDYQSRVVSILIYSYHFCGENIQNIYTHTNI
jgi:hypothetical protein